MKECFDEMFAVGQVYVMYLVKGNYVNWEFIDLEKSYDRVDRNEMWHGLRLRLYGVGGS